jgi:hypothetical protein
MIENTLIILSILFILYYCYNNVEDFTNLNPYRSTRKNRDIEKKIEIHHSSVLEIGNDEDDNKIFQFKGKMFKMNEDNVLEVNEPKKINYKQVPVKLPVIITPESIKSQIPLKFNDYIFTGLLNNAYYKQYYILYEKEYVEDPDMKNFKEKLYNYILAKKENNNLKIIHNIPPRNRVKPGDNIYFSYGNFQLGPLVFI